LRVAGDRLATVVLIMALAVDLPPPIRVAAQLAARLSGENV
jgi:hypothetical protein